MLLLMPLGAAGGQWWDGKIITDFRYEGLQNVSERTINDLLQPYEGEPFSDALFAQINDMLYAQPWLSYMSAEALVEGPPQDLVIQVDVVENPMVGSVEAVGCSRLTARSSLDAQEYKVGSFFTPGRLGVNADSIREHYVSRGYRDAQVEASYTEDAEANTVSIVYTVSEGRQYKVRSILFEGISGLSADALKSEMAVKEKTFFNNGNLVMSDLAADRQKVIALYGKEGYPDASVDDVEVVPAGEEDENTVYVNIVYTISEGDKWTIGDVTFSGNSIYSDDEIQALITMKPGDPYNSEAIMRQYEAVAGLYYDNGYIRSAVDFNSRRDESAHTISYDITITEGTQSIVEDIIITGLTKTQEYVFRREITLKPGDVFSRARLIRSQQNIMNTGLVTNVRAELLYGDTPDGVVVEFIIEEGNQMELQVGATFGGTVDGFPISGFLSWADRNLGGTARNLSISTTLSPDTQSVSISLSDNWVGDQRWSNGITFSVEHSYRDDTLQRGNGSGYYDGRDSAMQTFPLGYPNADAWYSSDNPIYPTTSYLMAYDYWRISLGYNTGYTFAFDPGNLTLSGGISFGLNHAIYDENLYDPYEELIMLYHERWQWSNRLTLGITWDGRDLVRDTTRGYLLSASYTYAGGILGGLSNYNRLTVSGSAYHSLFGYVDEEGRPFNLVLSFSTSVSFMFDQYWARNGSWDWYSAKQGATKYEMLYIDGMNIGRGFDVEYDKSFLWHNEIDLTWPLVYQVLAVEGFISATGVTSELSELSAFTNIDWYFAAGIGLKMQIPGFPLGLYIVKNATWTHQAGFQWSDGFLFSNPNRPGSGLKIVLAITTTLY